MPYFNAPMFLQNKTQIGKIEEIFGAINDGVRPATSICCLDVWRALQMPRAYPAMHYTLSRSSGNFETTLRVCCAIGIEEMSCCCLSNFACILWLSDMKLMPVQHFTIKMQEGIVATSYAAGDKFFIDPYKLLPMDRFLPRPKGAPSPGGRGEQTGCRHSTCCWPRNVGVVSRVSDRCS